MEGHPDLDETSAVDGDFHMRLGMESPRDGGKVGPHDVFGPRHHEPQVGVRPRQVDLVPVAEPEGDRVDQLLGEVVQVHHGGGGGAAATATTFSSE